jgi:hypothetical protein
LVDVFGLSRVPVSGLAGARSFSEAAVAKLYITPQKLLTMELGADFDELEDVRLHSLCAQATSWIDSYCAVPRAPQVHDFRGGSITTEQHQWRYPASPFDIGQRRVFVYHRPLLTVSQLRIYVSKQPLFLEIAPDHLVINHSAGYADIVALALTPSGIFNALVVPNVGLFVPQVEINYTYGQTFPVAGEYLYPTDGWTFRAENQWWVTDPAPVVYVDSVEQTTGFTINSDEGTVVFDAQQTAETIVTADYTHRLANEIMQAAGHIAAYLRGGSKMRQRGMDRLESLRVAEVTITRQRPQRGVDAGASLEQYVPEAAMLLAGWKQDGLVVR